jgi:hypothetical protein
MAAVSETYEGRSVFDLTGYRTEEAPYHSINLRCSKVMGQDMTCNARKLSQRQCITKTYLVRPSLLLYFRLLFSNTTHRADRCGLMINTKALGAKDD